MKEVRPPRHRARREGAFADAWKLAGLATSLTFLASVLVIGGQGNPGKTGPGKTGTSKAKAGTQTKAAATPVTFERDVLPAINQYCAPCHGSSNPTAGVSLVKAKTAAQAKEQAELWTRVLKNIENKHMPPKGMPAPNEAQRQRLLAGLRAALTVDCDTADPGRVTLRRLNRAEYNNTIRDLTGVNFRPADDFPSDDVGYGFDNIGDVLSVSPLLVEKYLNAAEQIAAQAIFIPPTPITLTGPDFSAGPGMTVDDDSVDFFSSGIARHRFEVKKAGIYTFRISGYASKAGPDPAQMSVTFNGQPLGKVDVTSPPPQIQAFEWRVKIDKPGLVPFSFGFLNDFYDEKLPEGQRDRNLYIKRVELVPVVGEGSIPESHRRIMIATPEAGKERDAAKTILGNFATRAYRRPASPDEVERLLKVYDLGMKNKEGFERSIQLGVTAALVSPNFLFRAETEQRSTVKTRELNDFELASRLSYFLWSSMPDERLFTLARQGKLTNPQVLRAEAARMIADPKANALADNFAEQWLNLRKLEHFEPDLKMFPTWSEELKDAMKQETKMFFMFVLRQDRSVLDFLDGKYGFMNEALAKHYGVSGVTGKNLQRVALTAPERAGVLTQASVLAITSNPTRTSPVKRGKWVLENILGTPPPPPPPGVGDLGDNKEVLTAKGLRERLEQHRNKPDCFSCHSRMDPIGFGMENFDAVGRWRNTDDGAKIDSSGVLPDGRKFAGPAELRHVLMGNKKQFVQTLSERLLTYALGRGIGVSDQCFVDEVTEATVNNNYKMGAMIGAIVTSDAFTKRRTTGP